MSKSILEVTFIIGAIIKNLLSCAVLLAIYPVAFIFPKWIKTNIDSMSIRLVIFPEALVVMSIRIDEAAPSTFDIVFPCSLKIETILEKVDSGSVFFMIKKSADVDSLGGVGYFGFIDFAETFLQVSIRLLDFWMGGKELCK